MELRVWVDGTQRVVCGVKLTTTCQEIVFALAHATQQAGRFTMIERWRNNERLLSPNEQPLVTLQRWGDRMNEVEFILKKTSTDPQLPTDRASFNQIPSLNQQASSTSAPHPKEHTGSLNDNDSTHQQVLTNGHRESPANHASSITNQPMTDQNTTSILQQARHYDPNRRPQTGIGQLSSSNSASNLGSGYIQTAANRLSNSFRPSLSTSTLSNSINNMTAPPASSSSLRSRFQTEHMNSDSPSLSMNDPHNGFQMHNEQLIHHQQIPNQSRGGIPAKNYPYEDLYSTINKKRINHLPPAVPAKPRMMNPTLPQQSIQANNGQMKFYPNSNAVNIYPSNLRPRHPPGYLEYLEAMANRNSMPPSLVPTSNFVHQNQQLISGNNYGRQFESQLPLYNIPANESSPAGSSTSNQYLYHGDGQYNRASLGVNRDFNAPGSLQNINPVKDNLKLVEPPDTLMNRNSAVHARNISISQTHLPHNSITSDDNLNTSVLSNASSVSQMALDLLKVIGEQKKVLMNQKNELDRLDNDQEYIDAKQSSEQAELINLIESEIHQLEELWRENQTQINKLENHDYESELEQLKSEQVRMEQEIASQKIKLKQCESDIAECKTKIEQLESELNDCGAESDSSAIGSAGEMNPNGGEKSRSDTKSDDLNTNRMDSHTDASTNNGTKHQLYDNKDPKSSEEEEEDDDDSGGDASDDLNTNSYESSNKLRCTKEVAYVDKRGLISGIRSLKLEKSRALNKSIESLNSNDSASVRNLTSNSPVSKDKPTINNNILDTRCTDAPNGQEFEEKTANSNNYEFLMTL